MTTKTRAKPYVSLRGVIQVGSKLKVRKTLCWSNGIRKFIHFRKGEIVKVSEIVLHPVPSTVGGQDWTEPHIVPAIFVRPVILRESLTEDRVWRRERRMRRTHGSDILKEYSPIE